MKIIVAGKRDSLVRIPIIVLASALLVASFVLLFSRVGGQREVSAKPDDNAFEVSAVLGALDSLGARDVEQAIEVWSQGVASRNCASQYAVMSDALRERYLEVIGDTLILESTPTSVDSWYVSAISDNEGVTTAKLLFTISSGEGESVAASAELTLEEEGGYTVISSVPVESPLYEFTGISA